MNTRQLFKQRVIELIYGLPYAEAVMKEGKNIFIGGNEYIINTIQNNLIYYFDNDLKYRLLDTELDEYDKITGYPITLSRVMQALNNKDLSFSVDVRCDGLMIFAKKKVRQIYSCTWKLLKEDKSTADDDFQDDSVIEALYNLIK